MQKIILKGNQSESFSLISYPDGQHSIRLHLDKLNVKENVRILCRIKNFSELEVLSCLIAALRKHDFYIAKLQFAYLFGIRSDRSFSAGEPSYLRDVLAPVINSYKIPKVELIWPFEPLGMKYIKNCNLKELDFALPELQIDHPPFSTKHRFLLCGDESAKNFYLAKQYYFPFYFEKTRSLDGKISVVIDQFVIENYLKNNNIENITIVDDLCDGGTTFIEEAKYIKNLTPNVKLELFIYHGLFTRGLEPLLEHFEVIHCLNSYQDIDNPRVKQIKVI